MKLTKRFLALLLCLCTVLTLIPAINANAATQGVLTYTVSNGKATVTGCDGDVTGTVTIPSTLGGYPVTAIGYAAFDECEDMTGVVIPNGVTTIDKFAFSTCFGLKSVTIPNSVTEIGYWAFFGCHDLVTLNLGTGVKTIGENAFAACISLTKVTIPASVTTIEVGAFTECDKLTNITVNAANTKYCSINGALYSKDKKTLVQVGAGVSGKFTIPSHVTTVGPKALYSCSDITSVVIPSSVTKLGEYAFAITKLSAVTLPGTIKELKAEVIRLLEENKVLKNKITELQSKNS